MAMSWEVAGIPWDYSAIRGIPRDFLYFLFQKSILEFPTAFLFLSLLCIFCFSICFKAFRCVFHLTFIFCCFFSAFVSDVSDSAVLSCFTLFWCVYFLFHSDSVVCSFLA